MNHTFDFFSYDIIYIFLKYQSSAKVEDVDFRESFGSILDSMMSDIQNDTILSKKAKKKSSRLGKVLNNIRKRKVPPCGTNTFTDPDSVREVLKKLRKFLESENE